MTKEDFKLFDKIVSNLNGLISKDKYDKDVGEIRLTCPYSDKIYTYNLIDTIVNKCVGLPENLKYQAVMEDIQNFINDYLNDMI